MLKEMALGGGNNVEAEIVDEPAPEPIEPIELPPPAIKKEKPKKPKKKKVKKVVVNNYYEPEESSSDEELIEEQNNFYSNNKKKGRKVSIAPNPNTQEYLNDENIEYEEEVVATNHYTFNPYGNIRFC